MISGAVPRLAAVCVLAAVVISLAWGIGAGGRDGVDVRSRASDRPTTSTMHGARVKRTPARIVSVVDGDTIRVMTMKGAPLPSVRILGISAPEIPQPGQPGECYGRHATVHLERMLPAGSTVVLVGDPTQDTIDAYGRLLRYVQVGGRDIGRTQIAAGAAQARASTPAVKRQQTYRDAARVARADAAGMWSACR